MAAYLTPGWWGVGTFTMRIFKKVGLGRPGGVYAFQKRKTKSAFFEFRGHEPV